jgi:hypothetical protein
VEVTAWLLVRNDSLRGSRRRPRGNGSRAIQVSAAAAALRVEAGAREAIAKIYEEEGNEEAAEAGRDHARYLCGLAEQLERSPLNSLIYTRPTSATAPSRRGVGEGLALLPAHEWARYIQDTAASLCAEQLLAVIGSGQP